MLIHVEVIPFRSLDRRLAMKSPERPRSLARKFTRSWWDYCLVFMALCNSLTSAWWVENTPPFRIELDETTIEIIDRGLHRGPNKGNEVRDQKVQLAVMTNSQQLWCEVISGRNATKSVACQSR
ncbi:uncharacterized protein LOC143258256 [Tachypleus tridentatus]|uniref:uncharacterized protein LOC143258256 n=1 Tax=Tachypleus tridentatus TaxID=6853 RepID=UPI003FCFF619